MILTTTKFNLCCYRRGYGRASHDYCEKKRIILTNSNRFAICSQCKEYKLYGDDKKPHKTISE
jgi:hypothetical protein